MKNRTKLIALVVGVILLSGVIVTVLGQWAFSGYRRAANVAVDTTTEHAETIALDALTGIDAAFEDASVELLPSDRFELEYHYYGNLYRLEHSVENGVLHLRERQLHSLAGGSFSFFGLTLWSRGVTFSGEIRQNRVIVRYPQGTAWQDVRVQNDYGDFACGIITAGGLTLEMDNGDAEFTGVTADAFTVRNDYGSVRLKDIRSASLAVEMENGDLTMDAVDADSANFDNDFGSIHGRGVRFGTVTGKAENGDIALDGDIGGAEIHNDFGSVELEFTGARADYELDLAAGYGEIELDGKVMEDDEGEELEHYAENGGAAKRVRVECENGDIVLRFAGQ